MSLYYCTECEKVTNTMICCNCGNQTEYVIGIDLASGEDFSKTEYIKVDKVMKE